MLHSKATAALLRLKEIDNKYKLRKEGRYTINSSTESTLSSPSMEHSIGDHKNLNNLEVPLKSKLNVRMPTTQIEEEEKEEKEEEEEEEKEVKKEEAAEEEDRSHSSTKEKASTTIIVHVETKSSENVEEEFSMNDTSLIVVSDENSLKKLEEKEISESEKEISESEKEINAKIEKSVIISEQVVKIKKEEAEVVSEVYDVETESSTSKISSEIEELKSSISGHSGSYVNETFEEASSTTLSTMKSLDDQRHTKKSLKLEKEDKMENSVQSGVKKIDILLNKNLATEQQGKQSNVKQIVELVPPKLMENTSECEIELDRELSNYVKTIENTDEDVSDIIPIRLLKPCKQMERYKRRKKYKRHLIAVKDDHVKGHSQSNKTITESLTASKNNRRSLTHDSLTPINNTEKVDKVKDEIGSMQRKTNFEKSGETEQRNIEDKRNKSLDEREHSMTNKNLVIPYNNNCLRTVKNLRMHIKRKKKKTKVRTLRRPDNVMDFNQDTSIKLDMKKMYNLRKKISKLVAGLNLEDPSPSKKLDPILFQPLDFPTLANYTPPDMDILNLTKRNPYIGLHEKLAVIKQWLKDQYIFYRVRSSLVEIINEKYVPMNLEDAKTVIRKLQKTTVEAR